MNGPVLPDLSHWRQAAPREVIPEGVPFMIVTGEGLTILYQGASATGVTVPGEGSGQLYYRGPAPAEEPPTKGAIVYQDEYGEWNLACRWGDEWVSESGGEPVTFTFWAPIGEWRQRP